MPHMSLQSLHLFGHGVEVFSIIVLPRGLHSPKSGTAPNMTSPLGDRACILHLPLALAKAHQEGVDPDTKVGGDGIHVNPERSFGGTNGEPPSEASQLRKGGPGVLARKISKTYMANGAIYVIPELYL